MLYDETGLGQNLPRWNRFANRICQRFPGMLDFPEADKPLIKVQGQSVKVHVFLLDSCRSHQFNKTQWEYTVGACDNKGDPKAVYTANSASTDWMGYAHSFMIRKCFEAEVAPLVLPDRPEPPGTVGKDGKKRHVVLSDQSHFPRKDQRVPLTMPGDSA